MVGDRLADPALYWAAGQDTGLGTGPERPRGGAGKARAGFADEPGEEMTPRDAVTPRDPGPPGETPPDTIADDDPVLLAYPAGSFTPDWIFLARWTALVLLVFAFGLLLPGGAVIAWIAGVILALFALHGRWFTTRRAGSKPAFTSPAERPS